MQYDHFLAAMGNERPPPPGLRDRLATLLFGERSQVTRERVYVKDRRAHEDDQHKLDGPCAP